MNRRLFLKRSIGVATGLAAMPFVSPVLTASPRAQRGFSIRLVTDQPSRAIDRMSGFFQRTGVGASHIRFGEHVLAGQHVGDLVVTQGARLYNFWEIDGPIAGALRTIAQELDLPRRLSQPVMLSFSTEQVATEAAYVQIFQENLLLQQLRLDQNRVHHVVEGTSGADGQRQAGSYCRGQLQAQNLHEDGRDCQTWRNACLRA